MRHYLTARFEFSASHHLESPHLSEEEADQHYGPCRRMHGHNYRLEVTVHGTPDPRTGFFGNICELQDIVNQRIVSQCDHHHLNDTELFKDCITTMEGISTRIWETLLEPLQDISMELFEVVVAETENNIVRLRKDH